MHIFLSHGLNYDMNIAFCLQKGPEQGHAPQRVSDFFHLTVCITVQGEVASRFRQGGLTSALKLSGEPRGAGGNALEEGPHVAQCTTPNDPDNLPLGRSLSRNFVLANHLLNFQYDRSRVMATFPLSSSSLPLNGKGPADMVMQLT